MVVCTFYQQGRCKFGGMIWRPPTLLSAGAWVLTSPSRPLVLQIVASMNTLVSQASAPVIALERCRRVVLQVCLLIFCSPQVGFVVWSLSVAAQMIVCLLSRILFLVRFNDVHFLFGLTVFHLLYVDLVLRFLSQLCMVYV